MLWNDDVLSEMERLRREMNGLFSNFDRENGVSTYPLVNMYDEDDDIVVKFELPGVTKDKVNITYSDGILSITGNLEPLLEVKKMAMIRQERALGKFEKTIRLPVKIDQNGINAAFSNGILTVTLPKAEEAKPKTIAIDAK
jgi:HSP20 family protein